MNRHASFNEKLFVLGGSHGHAQISLVVCAHKHGSLFFVWERKRHYKVLFDIEI